jgi:two-component sensor histidine kinase
MSSDASKYIEAASTLAVVTASNSPLLFLSADLTVIAASASFCRAFEVDPASIPGRKLGALGGGEWDMPRLRSLLSATASGASDIAPYEIDLVRKDQPVRNLVVNAHKLEDGNAQHVRLLLGIADITEARAAAKLKDDLIREKAVLLQEVQHRVANSLQIIASVLMQSARKVQSEEARGHLHDAHHRVMSIAAVQRQLSVSSVAEVALRPYFTQLCESLGASMIYDHRRLSIEARVDDSVAGADTSVSLGLIVTELVINALKHAFPGHLSGKIVVDYHAKGGKWTLSVSDNGKGMPSGPETPKPGLGTGIVEALSRQVGAEIEVIDGNPGTIVSLTHVAQSAVAPKIGEKVL